MIIPPWLKIFIVSALPISELRGSIPLGLLYYKLSLGKVLFWSLLGNILITAFLLLTLESLSKLLSQKFSFFAKIFSWFYLKTGKRHKQKIIRWGDFALVMLVALPLPFTGAWTGVLVSMVFGIKPKKAFPLITLGILTAGLIVTLLVLNGLYIGKLIIV